jgi:20S proteasome subunit beta 2
MYWDNQEEGGFNFKNYERNSKIQNNGYSVKTKKTGTTIVGVVFEGGVVLGADTRATEGPIVADPDCLKIHYLAPNIYCCGAGTAADTEFVTQMVASELELHRLNTKRESRVSQVESRLTSHLFKYQGNIGAALIVGGVDVNGPALVFNLLI